MKWGLIGLWVAAILFGHYRGQVRARWQKVFLDHSALLAPINALMVLSSRVTTKPYVPLSEFPELKTLQDQWQVFRDEALHLAAMQKIKAAENHDDIGFNSFFKNGWKRFYLKWYEASHPSAAEWCPRSVAILKSLPSVKAAMFAELPPGGQLNRHRDPYAGSLRYHLGLSTPNHDDCYIDVDGIRHSWRDGEAVVFDETYLHEAHNRTSQNRIILFCDIERPVRQSWVAALNRWFSRVVMSAASAPNDASDTTGLINRFTIWHHVIDEKRKALKNWNRGVYRLTKYSLLTLIVLGIVYF